MKRAAVVAENRFMSDEKINPYDLFEIDATYDVDLKALEKKYYALQEQIHPDRIKDIDPLIQLQAQLMSSTLNEAFETLKHPLHRGKAYAQAIGIKLPSDEMLTADPRTLCQVMEFQERLNTLDVPKDIRDLEKEVSHLFNSALQSLFQTKELSYWIQAIYFYKLLKSISERLKTLSTFHHV